MSAAHTYVLFCNGVGCDAFFITADAPPRKVGEVRDRAAVVGWTARLGERPGRGGPLPSLDFCPSCKERT